MCRGLPRNGVASAARDRVALYPPRKAPRYGGRFPSRSSLASSEDQGRSCKQRLFHWDFLDSPAVASTAFEYGRCRKSTRRTAPARQWQFRPHADRLPHRAPLFVASSSFSLGTAAARNRRKSQKTLIFVG